MSYPPPAYRSTSTLAVVSLIFGIATWFMLPLIGAIIAIVCGHLASSEIRRAPPGSMDGQSMATAGKVLGYIHLALILLTVAIVFSLFLFGVSFGFHSLHWN
jgi:Domain of unknown function (DUF4190)